MKKYRKQYSKLPSQLRDNNTKYLKHLNEIFTSRSWNNNNYYSSDGIKRELLEIYHHQCGYCNQIPNCSSLEVEHYRPKARPKENQNHSGYYWLGLEWSNLLLACSTCNKKKLNSFPVEDESNRVFAISVAPPVRNDKECRSYFTNLLNEQALIINPELDNPADYMRYNSSGLLEAKNEKGSETIRILQLNRDELYINGRKKIIDEIVLELGELIQSYKNSDITHKYLCKQTKSIIKKRIIDKIIAKDSFDQFLVHIINDTEYFILDRLSIDDTTLNKIRFIFNQMKYKLNI